MNGIIKNAAYHLNQRIHYAHKIEALTRMMVSEGVSEQAILAGTGLKYKELLQSGFRVSLLQLIHVMKNAIANSDDVTLGLRAGLQMRVSDYSFYGYALLSSPSIGQALQFAIRYHALVSPTMDMHIVPHPDYTFLRLNDILHTKELERFNSDFQLSVIFSLFKDMVGSPLDGYAVHLPFEKPQGRDYYAELLECPTFYKQTHTGFRLESQLLQLPLPKSNAITDASMIATCDQLMTEFINEDDLIHKIYRMFINNPSHLLTCYEIADKLAMSPRNLSRKLKTRNTSYQNILNDVRREIAIKYLSETQMRIDDIAMHLGFKNSVNFRLAFKKWTHCTPSAYRDRK